MVAAGRAVKPPAAAVQGVGETAVRALVEGTLRAHTLDVLQPHGTSARTVLGVEHSNTCS